MKELAQAIERPPHRWTPETLWQAYEALDRSKAILDTLRDAAAPSVEIVGMNYYHPFLPLVWFQTQDLGALQAEVASVVAFNDFVEGFYQAFGMRVADVESAFSLTDLTIQPSGLPLNVERGCQWTWMCSAGDIHLNADGHRVIAGAFEEVLMP